MKCLILGGGGFLGSHLSEALLAKNHLVRIFDRPNLSRFKPIQTHQNIEWVEGDFANREDVIRAVFECDVIYHLISTTLPHSSNINPIYDIETNLIGTLYLLEAALKNNAKKIIFVSSGGTVYGNPKQTPINELHPTEPICSYGIGKLAIEKYLHLFHLLHGLEYCILRFANPFGPRQRILTAQGAIATFAAKAIRNEVIEVWGDGSVVRDYFYISDAVAALTKALSYQGEQRIFNIGSGVGKSINDVLSAIDSLFEKPIKRAYLPARSFDVPVSILDISKALELLHWKPQATFSDGLSQTLHWLRNNN